MPRIFFYLYVLGGFKIELLNDEGGVIKDFTSGFAGTAIKDKFVRNYI